MARRVSSSSTVRQDPRDLSKLFNINPLHGPGRNLEPTTRRSGLEFCGYTRSENLLRNESGQLRETENLIFVLDQMRTQVRENLFVSRIQKAVSRPSTTSEDNQVKPPVGTVHRSIDHPKSFQTVPSSDSGHDSGDSGYYSESTYHEPKKDDPSSPLTEQGEASGQVGNSDENNNNESDHYGNLHGITTAIAVGTAFTPLSALELSDEDCSRLGHMIRLAVEGARLGQSPKAP